MSGDYRLYFGRAQAHDQFELYFIKYVDENSGIYHKLSGVDDLGNPIITLHEFKSGEIVEPILIVSGALFHSSIGKEGMGEFIDSLCEIMNYTPKRLNEKLNRIEKAIARLIEE